MAKKRRNSTRESTRIPIAHFSQVTDKPVDWRAALESGKLVDEPDDDDDRPAAEDVIGMLGFSPDELEEDEAPNDRIGTRISNIDVPPKNADRRKRKR